MKRLLNLIICRLFKIPRVNLDNCYPPVKYKTTSLDVETLRSEVFIERGLLVPACVYQKEIAHNLAKELLPYIEFETIDDPYLDAIKYRGTIRIVKER